MQINEHKSKKMVIRASHRPTIFVLPIPTIHRVNAFKLSGIVVIDDLQWNNHVAYNDRKANS